MIMKCILGQSSVLVNDMQPIPLKNDKLAVSQLQTCIPPPPSPLISLLWMMGSVLFSMGKIIKKFFNFYFSSYREKIHRKLTIFRTKMTKNNHNSKNKNGFEFFRFSTFRIFHVNLTNFEILYLFFYFDV